MIFASLTHAEEFKQNNLKLLSELSSEVEKLEGIERSEVWLCGNCPSFIAGYDDNEEQIVSLPIK